MSRLSTTSGLSSNETFASAEGVSISYGFPAPCPTGATSSPCRIQGCNIYDHCSGDHGFGQSRSDNENSCDFSCMGTSRGCCGDSSMQLLPHTDYGEPIKAQNVVIDFTPVKGVDDDQGLMKKCSDFWKLVASYPNLESLKALPEPRYSLSGDSGIQVQDESKLSPVGTPPNETASFWVEKEWMMNSALTTAMQQPACLPPSIADAFSDPQRKGSEVEKTRGSYSRRGTKRSSKSKGIWDSEQLCKEMDAWDQKHFPKVECVPERCAVRPCNSRCSVATAKLVYN